MDEYEKIKLLGKGGCASVFLVKSKVSKRLYALKEIELDPKRQTRTKEHVMKEASILSKLKHPHIVVCYDHFFGPNETFLGILQDYCDGGTIHDRVQEAKEMNQFLEEDLIAQWFIQVVMAVQYIHSQKVLHRDLKTQNVFLTRSNVAKLGDFGIAKVMENTVDVAQTCVGTPCYLSPELCQDLPYTSKADIWALGCMLYEMCALKFAFDANNLISLFYKIVKGEYEPISVKYSEDLRSLLSQLLMKEPEKRPSASSIINRPYTQRRLGTFIKDCEAKQVELHDKNALNNQNQRRPSSAYSAEAKDIRQLPLRSKSMMDKPSVDGDLKRLSNGHSRERKGSQDESNLMSEKETGNYADDFIEETGSDYSDDFEEDNGELENIKYDDGDDESAYPDDFEEYIEDEKDIEVVLVNARDLLEREDYDEEDVIEEEDESRKSNKNYMKEQCRLLLGDSLYRKIEEYCKSRKSNDETILRPYFEEMAGRDLIQSCFLVNQLVLGADPS